MGGEEYGKKKEDNYEEYLISFSSSHSAVSVVFNNNNMNKDADIVVYNWVPSAEHYH